jgi:hypothetical protein
MLIRAVLILALLPLSGICAERMVVNGKLKMDVLNKAFMESDWESVTRELEGFLKSKKTEALPAHDRIAAYKYLGTIYAADSLTRNRAETDFFLLLDLSPDIEIADLYVSNPINEFFQQVKRKHRAQKEYEAKFDSYGFPKQPEAKRESAILTAKPGKTAPETAPKPVPKPAEIREPGGHAWIWWTTGALAMAAIGTYLYLAYEQPPENKRISAAIRVPGPVSP